MTATPPHPANSAADSPKAPSRMIGATALLLGVLALGAPLLAGRLAFLVLGLLILSFGLIQNFTGFALRDPAAAGSWFSRGGASIVTGLLLLAMPKLTFGGLALLLGVSWIVSGGSTIAAALGRGAPKDWIWYAADGLVNVLLGLAIALQWPVSGIVSIGLYVGLRYVSIGWSTLVGAPQAPPDGVSEAAGLHPDQRLALDPHPYVAKLRDELANEELIRTRVDRGWCWLFLFIFFAIHVARMDVDWNLIGMLSPLGAVAGDVLLAIVLAYGIVAPISVTWRSA